ncbi:hypothetical protein [Xenorhabdus bharatensis]|uniref:hypothetical protein n=1 Tax=Xenorhabdus bharatensis TaxID=3136256 RepID=UPI0030F46E6A
MKELTGKEFEQVSGAGLVDSSTYHPHEVGKGTEYGSIIKMIEKWGEGAHPSTPAIIVEPSTPTVPVGN